MKGKNILKQIGNVLFYLLIVLILVFTISVSKAKKTGNQATILGHQFYTVLTGSMSPTINPGSLVVVKQVNPNSIKSGDIITFGNSSDSSVTTHRVKDIITENGLKFITQGDANNVEDPMPLDSNLIIGKVVYFIPIIGATLIFIQENTWLLWGIMAVIIIISLIPSNKSRKVNV